MSKSLMLAVLSAHAASATYTPFLSQGVVKKVTKQAEGHARALMRLLDDHENEVCDPSDATMQSLMTSSDCKGLGEAMESVDFDGSGSGPGFDIFFDIIEIMCQYGKCIQKFGEAGEAASQTPACLAYKASLSGEFADCAAQSSNCQGEHCFYNVNDDGSRCVDDREGGGDDLFASFQPLCARKDDGSTCFEAVFKPFAVAMEALSSESDAPVVLNEECGAVPADGASEIDQQIFGCCTLESYGCCLVTIQEMFGGANFDEAGQEASVIDECPALANVQACPNPFMETTYLKFDLDVPCLSDAKELALLEEGLVGAWNLDAGSIKLTLPEDGKVSVSVTVPQDTTAGIIENRIKGSSINTSALASHNGADCTVGDTAALEIEEDVVSVEGTSSASALVMVSFTALLALF